MNIDTYKQEAARLRPRLLLIARRYTGSDEEGEDIVQDCLLKNLDDEGRFIDSA